MNYGETSDGELVGEWTRNGMKYQVRETLIIIHASSLEYPDSKKLDVKHNQGVFEYNFDHPQRHRIIEDDIGKSPNGSKW